MFLYSKQYCYGTLLCAFMFNVVEKYRLMMPLMERLNILMVSRSTPQLGYNACFMFSVAVEAAAGRLIFQEILHAVGDSHPKYLQLQRRVSVE